MEWPRTKVDSLGALRDEFRIVAVRKKNVSVEISLTVQGCYAFFFFFVLFSAREFGEDEDNNIDGTTGAKPWFSSAWARERVDPFFYRVCKARSSETGLYPGNILRPCARWDHSGSPTRHS